MLGKVEERQRKKIYLNIKNGVLVRRTSQGEESYGYVEGVLEALTQRERNFHGETVLYWYLDLRDEQTDELYSLGFPYASNTFKSIILQLASKEGAESVKRGSTIRIEPYSKNGYDKVQVWGIDGVKLDWITKQLPPIEKTVVAGRTIKDDTKRMEYICQCADYVKASIGTATGQNW